jgi:hypothetical protein
MLGDRDLNVFISPLPRNKRAKNPRAEENIPEDDAAEEEGGQRGRQTSA